MIGRASGHGALWMLLGLAIACSDPVTRVSVAGDGELAGADIFIDGAHAGRLVAEGDHSGATLRVKPGLHLIEIRKEGFAGARESRVIDGTEAYLTLRAAGDSIQVFGGHEEPQ